MKPSFLTAIIVCIVLITAAGCMLTSCGTGTAKLPQGIQLSGSYVHPKTGAVVGISTNPDGNLSGSLTVPIKDGNGNTVGVVDLTATK